MDLSDAQREAASESIREAAVAAARQQAATFLVEWLGAAHISPTRAVDALLRRDPEDPIYRQLLGHEKPWAIAVAQLVEHATRPGPDTADAAAVADARERGATWGDIAAALDISAQSAHARYKAGTRRGGRRGPSPSA